MFGFEPKIVVYKMRMIYMIEPFAKVWINCEANLKISLLRQINEKYEYLAYENNYVYVSRTEESGGGNKFKCLTVKQEIVDYDEFAYLSDVKKKRKRKISKLIAKHLEDINNYVLVDVDLYKWLEGSVAWNKFHWNHYALLTRYDKETKRVEAFDELQGNYVKFQKRIKEVIKSITKEKQGSGIKMLTLNNSTEIPVFAKSKIVSNGYSLITSIKKAQNTFYFGMSENDYRARSHMELNGVYLQRISGRQSANSTLMELAGAREWLSYDDSIRLKCKFELLEKQWEEIRMLVYRIYFDETGRKSILDEVNHLVEVCLAEEKEAWEEFLQLIE